MFWCIASVIRFKENLIRHENMTLNFGVKMKVEEKNHYRIHR